MAKERKKKTQPVARTAKRKLPAVPAVTQPTEEKIAERAYQIYLERGGINGNAEEDWLQAERELSGGSST
ncbi:MAG TPA: DUF2934 domain-containing protein [Pyrinomonadaceae bacterium]|jgi:hypothetical protein|nr:DUF2934 domain-containing protein [Pyrinomonadaceae bacterium]